jgi:hypothetical protein
VARFGKEPGVFAGIYEDMTTKRIIISRPRSKSGATSLVGSSTSARREVAVLRRARERLENQPRVDETSARTGVAPRRMSRA